MKIQNIPDVDYRLLYCGRIAGHEGHNLGGQDGKQATEEGKQTYTADMRDKIGFNSGLGIRSSAHRSLLIHSKSLKTKEQP